MVAFTQPPAIAEPLYILNHSLSIHTCIQFTGHIDDAFEILRDILYDEWNPLRRQDAHNCKVLTSRIDINQCEQGHNPFDPYRRTYTFKPTVPNSTHSFAVQTTHSIRVIERNTGLPPEKSKLCPGSPDSYRRPSGIVCLSYEIHDVYVGRDLEKYLSGVVGYSVEAKNEDEWMKRIRDAMQDTCYAVANRIKGQRCIFGGLPESRQ